MIGWDEILNKYLSKEVVVQSWRGLESINQIAGQGYQALLSAGYYIDQPQATAYHYRNDPLAYVNTASLVNKPSIVKAELEKWYSWSFTMPRLKGSAVRGELTLITNQSSPQHSLAYTNTLSGYVKLNDHFHKEVVIISSFNDFKNNKVTLRLIAGWARCILS